MGMASNGPDRSVARHQTTLPESIRYRSSPGWDWMGTVAQGTVISPVRRRRQPQDVGSARTTKLQGNCNVIQYWSRPGWLMTKMTRYRQRSRQGRYLRLSRWPM